MAKICDLIKLVHTQPLGGSFRFFHELLSMKCRNMTDSAFRAFKLICLNFPKWPLSPLRVLKIGPSRFGSLITLKAFRV